MPAPPVDSSSASADSSVMISPDFALDLMVFYDDFIGFQGCCAFLCDTFMSMSTTDMNLDEACVHGVHIFSGQVKRSAEELKCRLKDLQEKSCVGQYHT